MLKVYDEVVVKEAYLKKFGKEGNCYQMYAALHGADNKVYGSFETCKELALRSIIRCETAHKKDNTRLAIIYGYQIVNLKLKIEEFIKCIESISAALKIKAPEFYMGKNLPFILFVNFNDWNKNAYLLGILLYFSRVFLAIEKKMTPKEYIAFFRKGVVNYGAVLETSDGRDDYSDEISIEDNMSEIDRVILALNFLKMFGRNIISSRSKTLVRDSFEAGPIEFGMWLENTDDGTPAGDFNFHFEDTLATKLVKKFNLRYDKNNDAEALTDVVYNNPRNFNNRGSLTKEANEAIKKIEQECKKKEIEREKNSLYKTLNRTKVNYDTYWV